MSLTPLRFNRSNGFASRPLYGSGSYHTACRRFEIHREDGHWHVGIGPAALRTEWFDWFEDVGIAPIQFKTRRAALEAISAALDTDGLMDAPVPPSKS